MIFILDPNDFSFPDPNLAEPEGIIAVGGDLNPIRLLNAYASGIFPWYNPGQMILWWSLDHRMVLFPDEFRYSRSLCRVVKSGKFEVRTDTAFRQVMHHCATTKRSDQDGTWITSEMLEAYCRLHDMGYAHSFETYHQGKLVGGLYGVSLGQAFFGESMFHTMTDASKVAFVRLVEFCRDHRFSLIDAQQQTPHLASLGARPIPRKQYLDILYSLDYAKTLCGSWS